MCRSYILFGSRDLKKMFGLATDGLKMRRFGPKKPFWLNFEKTEGWPFWINVPEKTYYAFGSSIHAPLHSITEPPWNFAAGLVRSS